MSKILSNTVLKNGFQMFQGCVSYVRQIVQNETKKCGSTLKGHGNEADFLGFLQKLGPHRSLTLPFEPFRFWLQIRGDIRNRKTTPRLGESGSQRLTDSPNRGVGFWMFKKKTRESESRRLPDSANRGVANSPTRRVGQLSTPRLGESGSRHNESGSRYSNFLKFSIDFPDFKRLNQPFKRSIWQKEARDVM